MPLVMGVDASADATIVEVRDADDGTLVATGRVDHDGAERTDPGAWWDGLVAAVAAAGVRDVAALSVAAPAQGLVVLDAAGAVLRPLSLGPDLGAADELARLTERTSADKWARGTGSVPSIRHPITKLARLARAEPKTYARIGWVLAPHDLLTYRLTGRIVTDRGDASSSGYWSPADERWRTDLLERAVGRSPSGEWSDHLPDVLGPSDPSDYVTASQSPQLGLRGRPLCGPGTGRVQAIALGAAVEPGDVVVCIDGESHVSVLSEKPTADSAGVVAGWADASGRFLPTVGPRAGVGATAAVAAILDVDDHGLSALAGRADAGAGGLVLRPDPPGSLHGLRADVTREQVARAGFEGVVCNLLEGLEALQKAGVDVAGRLVLVGAGSAMAAYPSALADLSGREVVVPSLPAPAAAGACLQAAAVLAETDPLDVAAAWALGDGAVVEPAALVDRALIRSAFRVAGRPTA